MSEPLPFSTNFSHHTVFSCESNSTTTNVHQSVSLSVCHQINYLHHCFHHNLHHTFITPSSHLHHNFITPSLHLHHTFIKTSSHLHHTFLSPSSDLHHTFATPSSHLHHTFITTSSHLHHCLHHNLHHHPSSFNFATFKLFSVFFWNFTVKMVKNVQIITLKIIDQ